MDWSLANTLPLGHVVERLRRRKRRRTSTMLMMMLISCLAWYKYKFLPRFWPNGSSGLVIASAESVSIQKGIWSGSVISWLSKGRWGWGRKERKGYSQSIWLGSHARGKTQRDERANGSDHRGFPETPINNNTETGWMLLLSGEVEVVEHGRKPNGNWVSFAYKPIRLALNSKVGNWTVWSVFVLLVLLVAQQLKGR